MSLRETFSNAVDRTIELFSPQKAVERKAARTINEQFGQYKGAQSNRLNSSWSVSSGSADYDLLPDLPVLRERSRELLRNDPHAASLVNTMVDNIVGTGIRPQAQIDAEALGLSEEEAAKLAKACEKAFSKWMQYADVGRRMNFYDIQSQAMRSIVVNGESLILPVRVERKFSPYDLAIEVIEPDRIEAPGEMDQVNGRFKRLSGIELGKNGYPHAVWVKVSHPGDGIFERSSDNRYRKILFTNADGDLQVFHLMNQNRPGQTRGEPMMSSAMQAFKDLSSYTEAVITKERVAACHTLFISKQDAYSSALNRSDEILNKQRIEEISPGQINYLQPGEEVSFGNPPANNSATYDAFVTREGYIWQAWERSDQRQFHVPCPHCHELQTLSFAQVKFPEDQRDPAIIRQERLAWYECLHCKGTITDLDKAEMLSKGQWISEGKPGTHRGYRIHCLYSPWLTFSEVAAKFLESKDDVPSLMNFVNSWLGWIFEEESSQIEEDQVAKRVTQYARGTVPSEAMVLTAGVDIQKNQLYYTVRAWGLKEQSWLIECGVLEGGLDLLVDVLMTRSWGGHRLRLACIDSGYRTDEVYRFCRKWPELAKPVKGQRTINGVPIKSTKIDRNATGDVVRGSVRLFHLDTHHFKDKLTRLMTATDGDHGAWHLHEDVPQEYLRQVTSEHKVLQRNRRTGATSTEWVTKPGAGANHWFDCEVYSLAAAEILGVWAMQEQAPRPVSPPPSQAQSNWVKQKGGWING